MSDELREHIARTVADWPSLTHEQRSRVAVLLRGGGAHG